MVDLATGSVSPIKHYQSLQNIMISVNQQIKHMNNAWKLKNDYGKVCDKRDAILPILGVWRLESGCNTFKEVSARVWNRF